MSVDTALSEDYLTATDAGHNGIGDNWGAIFKAIVQGHIPQQHEDLSEFIDYDLALSPMPADLGNTGSAGGDNDRGSNAVNQGGLSNGYIHSSSHWEGFSTTVIDTNFSAIPRSIGLPLIFPSFPGPSLVQGGQLPDSLPPYTSTPFLPTVGSLDCPPTMGMNVDDGCAFVVPSTGNGTNLEMGLGAQPTYPNMGFPHQPPLFCAPSSLNYPGLDQHANVGVTTSYLQNPLKPSPSPAATQCVSGRQDTVGVNGGISGINGRNSTTENVTPSIPGRFGGSNGMQNGEGSVPDGRTRALEPIETMTMAGLEWNSRSFIGAPNDLNRGDDLDKGKGKAHTTPMGKQPSPPKPTSGQPFVLMSKTGLKKVVDIPTPYTPLRHAPIPPCLAPASVVPGFHASNKERERSEEAVQSDCNRETKVVYVRTKRANRKGGKVGTPQVPSSKRKERAISIIPEGGDQGPSFDNNLNSSSPSPLSLPPVVTLSRASSSGQESSSPGSNGRVYYTGATSAESLGWGQRGEGKAKDSAGLVLAKVTQMNGGSPTGPRTILGDGTGNHPELEKRNTRIPSPIPGLTKGLRGRKVPKIPTASAGESRGLVADRPFVCQTPGCYKAFMRKEHLQRHLRCVHSDERKYRCPHDGCGKYFNRQDNLIQHSKVHLRQSTTHKQGTPDTPDPSTHLGSVVSSKYAIFLY